MLSGSRFFVTDLAGPFKTANSGCSLQCGAGSSCGDCQELSDIDKEVEKAENMARQAKTRRSDLLARVNSRRDALTSKLPVEIVCYIFEVYVQLHQEDTNIRDIARPRFFAPIHRSGPLRLGAICRNWRSIAWAHSRLWKTLVIAISSPGHDAGPIMVEEWLQRTGEQQLEVQMGDCQNNRDTLVGTPSGRPQMMMNARSIVRALNSVSSRWRSLDLSECPLDILSALDDTGCAANSILQHLCLGYHSEERRSYSLKLLKSKHRHQPVHLNILCAIRPSRVNIKWTQLTHLYLENMSSKHCLRTLTWVTKSSPALSHLTLRLMDDFSHMDLGGETYYLRHPALESLGIHEEECDEDTASLLFGAFTLPALRTLKYYGDDEGNDFPTDMFLAFLNRSACSLETLEIVNPCIEDDQLERILRAVPTVRTLNIELTDENHSSFLFECLAQKDLHRHPALPFLPNLARLNITAEAPRHWRTFIGMFVDDPTVRGTDFGQKRPTRHALQVTFKVQPGIPCREMDLKSLSQLVFLWRKYQFFSVFQFVDDSESTSVVGEVGFLAKSYRIGIMSLASPALDKFVRLEEHLTVMSTLSF
ncbi:hypothetical protein D9619_012354 [Psilocybe cf. subviscida]|uniref:F-box domain-containing protein n=1 Tax=Psilocybe cf. subviscida TaxID=2480587 RepID=A0A8H5AQZ6_9AGAR|nr:hypothetical protein D9619_012354 [Psilocybe cf. subviscida]